MIRREATARVAGAHSGRQTGGTVRPYLGALVALAILPAMAGCNSQPRSHASAPVAMPEGSSITSATLDSGPSPTPGKPLPSQDITQDATMAVQRMVAAYKALDSLQVTSEADLKSDFTTPGVSHQESVLKFVRHPAQVALLLRDPVGGSQSYIADGKTIVHYQRATNMFTYLQRSPTSDVASIAREIDRKAPQLMSPVAFLISGSMPLGVESVRMAGTEKVGGKEALKITGAYTSRFLRGLAQQIFQTELTPVGREFTIWLDPHNYLVLQSSAHLAWRGQINEVSPFITETSKSKPFTPHMEYLERVTELIQNPTLPAKDFHFVPPTGAVLLEGGRPAQ